MSIRTNQKTEQLTCKIGLRVSQDFFEKLEGWTKHSNCRTVSEMARKILYEERIVWYTRDSQMDATAAELAGIRRELRAIGVNINQVTKYFHSTRIPSQKVHDALKILDEFKVISTKVDALLTAISNFSDQWSPR
ncbi:autophagy-related protein 17 [Parachryseolinea silvisoli]|uniref:autophagy-related protein 17 n=1 Tax=Parachryseolinea silvisoli TaxID=2873601 RepID=UPI002265CCC9|nr:autophagy-related protein 17 [Parachryseolinea silvisoli]MCD9015219.1 plasmid mobilization relaxosome protein MobC [Parachryseolinea silvisoli]